MEMLFSGMAANGVVTVLSIILAIAATIVLLIMVIPEKKRESLPSFFKKLHDVFNFKQLLIEKILKITYVFLTVLSILTGILMIIIQAPYMGIAYSNYGGGNAAALSLLYGLILIVIVPTAIRLIYEGMMMFILLVKNTIEINKKLKNQNGDVNKKEDAKAEPVKVAPAPAPVAQPYQPKMGFCAYCGTQYDKNAGKCPNCGK